MDFMAIFERHTRNGQGASPRPRPILLALLIVVVGWIGGSPIAADLLYDRIVAAVDDQPIFLSDIERLITLDLVEKREGEAVADLHRRVLDGLIDQRLRLREVERFDFGPVSTVEIDRQLEFIRERFGGEEPLNARLASVGLDIEDLRYLLTQQFKILVYIEERLGPRVLIDLEEIRNYYDNELAEMLSETGDERPPFEEVQDAIRVLLREQRLNEEIEIWTDQLRQKADIVDLLDRNESELPPVVERQKLENEAGKVLE